MKNRKRQSGYSLAEMLTVVAIIGVLALVMVPNFMSFYESNKMKSTMRTFTSDLRSTRQLAIAQGKQAMIVYGTGATARTYDIWLGDKQFNSLNWTPQTGPNANPPKATKALDTIAYFPTGAGLQTFTDTLDCSSGTNCQAIPPGTPDGLLEVIFFPDGRVQLPTGATSGTITLKTDQSRIPKPLYTITISPTGRVQAQ
jgi:prepilin-type N-terminal cleavage/methylation domain-containing protein